MMNQIIKFQSKHGLKPDGIIGRNTLTKMSEVFNIKNKNQLNHFISNTEHETGGFNSDTENLNYSAQSLMKVFKKYFKSQELANLYARKPEKIANRVYANRMGNGDEKSGEGWKYIGRGSLQLTGKNNYRSFSEYVNDPRILKNPELVATEYFWESALFYFDKNKLWKKMEGGDDKTIKELRRAINGGYNGLDDVRKKFNHYKEILKDIELC